MNDTHFDEQSAFLLSHNINLNFVQQILQNREKDFQHKNTNLSITHSQKSFFFSSSFPQNQRILVFLGRKWV